MIRVFIPSHYPLEQIEQMLAQMQDCSIDTSNVLVLDTFDHFRQQIEPTDAVVVHSLNCFASMIDLLDQVRGLTVSSLCEPWFDDPSIDKPTYLEHLYNLAVEIHRERTQRGLNHARDQGKALGRAKGRLGKLRITDQEVARVDVLRRNQKLSLAAACRVVGCSVNSYNTYYKHRRQNL